MRAEVGAHRRQTKHTCFPPYVPPQVDLITGAFTRPSTRRCWHALRRVVFRDSPGDQGPVRAQPRRLGACAAHAATPGGRGCGAGDSGVAVGPAPVWACGYDMANSGHRCPVNPGNAHPLAPRPCGSPRRQGMLPSA